MPILPSAEQLLLDWQSRLVVQSSTFGVQIPEGEQVCSGRQSIGVVQAIVSLASILLDLLESPPPLGIPPRIGDRSIRPATPRLMRVVLFKA